MCRNCQSFWKWQGGPSALTTSVDQQPTDCTVYRLGPRKCWSPLTLWYHVTWIISWPGPLPSLVSDPGWRGGGMHQWSGSIFRRWWLHSSLHLSRVIASTPLSSPGVGPGWPGPTPPAHLQPPLWSLMSTSYRVPACCKNNPGRCSWYLSESLVWSCQSVSTVCPAWAWSPGLRGCWRSWWIVPRGAAAVSAVEVAPCEVVPLHVW